MSKSTTEQAETSKDNKALDGISQRELNEFMHEDDSGYTRRRRILEAVYRKAISDDKDALYAGNSLLDRDMGKATEKRDITSGGQSLQPVIVLDMDTNGD